MRWVAVLFALGLVGTASDAQALDVRPPIGVRVEVWEPSSYVGGLAESDDGSLWLATRTGLQRFDGRTFTVMGPTTALDLPDDQISCVTPAPSGGMWVGMSRMGLVRLSGSTVERWTTRDGLPSNTVTALAAAAQGDLWVGTNEGLVRLHEGKVVARFQVAEGLADGHVILILLRPEVVVVETVSGLSRIVGDHVVTEPLQPAFTSSRRHRMLREFLPPGAPAIDDPLWNTLPPVVSGAISDRDGNIWIGTSSGLIEVAGGRVLRFGLETGMAGSHVSTVSEDADGNLWATTLGGGLSRLSAPRMTSLTTRQGLPHSNIAAVVESAGGDLWISTEGGLAVLHEGRISSRAIAPGDPGAEGKLRSLAFSEGDRLWALDDSRRLLSVSSGEDATLRAAVVETGDAPLSAMVTDEAGQLWVTQETGNLLRIGRKGEATAAFHLDGPVTAMASRAGGGVWLGGAGGNVQAVDSRGSVVKSWSLVAPGGTAVTTLAESPAGILWVGTRRALVRLDSRTGAAVTIKGTADRAIASVVPDGPRLWVGTERGIVRLVLDPTDVEASLLSSFGREDGLKNDEIGGWGTPAGVRTRDGRLFFATGNGLAVIEAAARWSPFRRLVPAVTGVVVDGVATAMGGPPLVLAPGHGNVEIQYAAAAVSWPHRVRFRHRLDGFDNRWIDAGDRRSAQYTNLRPGTYTFRLEAERDGENERHVASALLTFELRAHFWQTRPFVALVFASIVAVGFLWQRQRVRQVQARFAAVLLERNRIARDLHDALAQVFSAMGFQIDKLARALDQGPAGPRQDARRLRQMVAHGRLAARNVVTNLRAENPHPGGFLESLREMAQLYEGVVFRVQVEGDVRPLSAAVERELGRIAEEAVSNAIAHGEAQHVSIELIFEEESCSLWVRDDGRGFVVEGGDDPTPGGFGLLGMRERAARLGGRIEIASETGVGTEIGVIVPRQCERAGGAA